MTYIIYIGSAELLVSGHEAAYTAYHKACELGNVLGLYVALADHTTGEVLADNEDVGE